MELFCTAKKIGAEHTYSRQKMSALAIFFCNFGALWQRISASIHCASRTNGKTHCMGQGCQIFLGPTYQNWKNIPNNPNICQMATKYTNGHRMDQMAIKYTKICHCKSLRNLPKIMIFGFKICHLATLVWARQKKVTEI
jgi:hypothetical protein